MTISTDVDAREVLAGRLVDGLTGALETLGVYLGVDSRYAREWLEQQAVAARCWSRWSRGSAPPGR